MSNQEDKNRIKAVLDKTNDQIDELHQLGESDILENVIAKKEQKAAELRLIWKCISKYEVIELLEDLHEDMIAISKRVEVLENE